MNEKQRKEIVKTLLIAFALARRMATRRYTYGYGRAEDLAGLVIVLLIAALPRLTGALVHADPQQGAGHDDPHAVLLAHR